MTTCATLYLLSLFLMTCENMTRLASLSLELITMWAKNGTYLGICFRSSRPCLGAILTSKPPQGTTSWKIVASQRDSTWHDARYLSTYALQGRHLYVAFALGIHLRLWEADSFSPRGSKPLIAHPLPCGILSCFFCSRKTLRCFVVVILTFLHLLALPSGFKHL